jgi:hypothetical protein
MCHIQVILSKSLEIFVITFLQNFWPDREGRPVGWGDYASKIKLQCYLSEPIETRLFFFKF